MEIPNGIIVEVIKNTTLDLKGCNKEELGLFARKFDLGVPQNHIKEKVLFMKVNELCKKSW